LNFPSFSENKSSDVYAKDGEKNKNCNKNYKIKFPMFIRKEGHAAGGVVG
jgi:glutathione peroxidase-family protein